MEAKKRKTVFVNGPIAPAFIAEAIGKHSTMPAIGAHSIFLGQVRNDEVGGKTVRAITYSAYTEMAEETLHNIRESAFEKYDLSCMHIYHSLGEVATGEICLFVFTSSKHRAAATEACSYLVERIKKEAPIWGKELFAEGAHNWKENN